MFSRQTDLFSGTWFIAPDVIFKTTNAGALKKRGYPDRRPSGSLVEGRTMWFDRKINKMVHRTGIVLVQTHFIQHKQFSETNVPSHAFQQTLDLKIVSECFCGPLKTPW